MNYSNVFKCYCGTTVPFTALADLHIHVLTPEQKAHFEKQGVVFGNPRVDQLFCSVACVGMYWAHEMPLGRD